MISDIWAIIWKEWKELLPQRDLRGGPVRLLIFIGVFGILLPLQAGRAWVDSPIGLLYWAWVPIFLVIGVIADAFAGERERHTLETLLASRLSDQAILFGKIAAAIGYGWGMAMVGMLLGLVTVNLTHAQEGLILYPLIIGLSIVILSLLTSGFAAGIGVLVSLRASTVRQAQQTLSIAMTLLLVIPIFGSGLLPTRAGARLVQVLVDLDISGILLIVTGAFALLDLGLLLVAMSQFKRSRLILD